MRPINSSAERRTLPETTHTPIRFPISAISTAVIFLKRGEVSIAYRDLAKKFNLTLETLKQDGAEFLPGKVDVWMDCGKKDPTVDTNKKILGFCLGAQLIAESLGSKVYKNQKYVFKSF